MSELEGMKCVACRGGEPQITPEERTRVHPQVPAWENIEREGIERLERVFAFENFVEAVRFTNAVAAIAEAEGHHPAILTEWGKVTVSWWTRPRRPCRCNWRWPPASKS